MRTHHHNRILLIECEKQNQILYFRKKKNIPNSDRLRLRIIQLTHNNVLGRHFDRTNCYELINRAYWWFNLYQYIQRFVRNCHVCIRIKSFRQKYQKWFRPLFISERRWRDIFIDYIGSLFFSIFMRIIYRYILVFVDRLIKMIHFILTVIMKTEETVNAFYIHI